MNPLQRASRNRKIIYIAVILGLFTVSMVWRGMIPVPLGTSPASAAQPMRWAAAHTIKAQARSEDDGGLGLSDVDESEGEAEITGSAARLALTGSRGFVVMGLWLSAIDKQKRNDFHEFEQRVQMVTKLQPNFITPWIFQSWNITYNVSVEMQGSGDMYYYIVRGIQLLAEGERRNRRSPDMRYQIAFYYQNKFGVSDTVEVLRCLYDLSCMPPTERDPGRFKDPVTGGVKLEEFRKFCEEHPHFVRRLRGEEAKPRDRRAKEKLRAESPDDIVKFLEANYADLPARYRKNGDKWTEDLADADKQFPSLPPKFPEGAGEADPERESKNDFAPGIGYFSAFKAARAWFAYSLRLLPPPPKDGALRGLPDDQGDPIPGPTPAPGTGGHNPAKHRVPRLPTMILFRQGAPRAQSYCAELEQKEGWFDGEGWTIDTDSDPNRWWFPDNPNPALRSASQGVVAGRGREWSLDEWKRAAELWDRHGQDYALTLSDRQLANLRRIASEAVPANTPATEDAQKRRFIAGTALQYYATNRQTTNFPFFLASAQAEARVIPEEQTINGQRQVVPVPQAVVARKTLWKAEQARKKGENLQAIELYKDGLEKWKKVLANNPAFHRPSQSSERAEEETCEFELTYQRLLVQHDERVRKLAEQSILRAQALVPHLSAADALWPEANREEVRWLLVETVSGAPFSSPFVGTTAPDGSPWMRDEIRESIRQKQGVSRRPVPQAPSAVGGQPPPGSPPGPPR